MVGVVAVMLAGAMIAGPSSAAGQCPKQWFPGEGMVGAGSVLATAVWDPDGAGPGCEVLFVGGFFTVAGNTRANGVACWDPATSTWSSLGSGINGPVYAFAVLDGKLYAGGSFGIAGGVSTSHVACWDPATRSWSALGSGIADPFQPAVYALTVLDGKLYVGGHFATAGGVSANNVACWDPATSTWSALGVGLDEPPYYGVATVHALTVLDGKLYTGGRFTTAGGVATQGVACWDPATSSWSSLGSGVESSPFMPRVMTPVCAALAAVDGKLYAGGGFRAAGGVSATFVACWDTAASTWSPLGSGINGGRGSGVAALAILDGKLYAGGPFAIAGDVISKGIACWNPTTSVWSAVGSGTDDAVQALTVMDDKVYVGGLFMTVGGVSANRIACWDPATLSWSALGSGVAGAYTPAVHALTDLDGKLYAGGHFATAGGVSANHVACWDPVTSTWSALGSGVGGGAGSPAVDCMAVLDGKLYAGGDFTTAGGVTANRIACWDPVTSTWSALGTGLIGSVGALTVMDGKLYVGGSFTTAGGVSASKVACWDPGTSTWSALGSGVSGGAGIPSVYCMAVLDGKLYVGGYFTTAGGTSANNIACWDPATSTWSPLGSGKATVARALATLDGRLYVGGIGCWDPTLQTWSALGSGVGGSGGTNVEVLALTVLEHTLYVGGGFTTAGGQVSAYFARWGAGPRADFDCDLDVDGDDLDLFEACASGPGIDHNGTPICQTTDLDDDSDVDQTDFGLFQRCLSGESVLADANCSTG